MEGKWITDDNMRKMEERREEQDENICAIKIRRPPEHLGEGDEVDIVCTWDWPTSVQ